MSLTITIEDIEDIDDKYKTKMNVKFTDLIDDNDNDNLYIDFEHIRHRYKEKQEQQHKERQKSTFEESIIIISSKKQDKKNIRKIARMNRCLELLKIKDISNYEQHYLDKQYYIALSSLSVKRREEIYRQAIESDKVHIGFRLT